MDLFGRDISFSRPFRIQIGASLTICMHVFWHLSLCSFHCLCPRVEGRPLPRTSSCVKINSHKSFFIPRQRRKWISRFVLVCVPADSCICNFSFFWRSCLNYNWDYCICDSQGDDIFTADDFGRHVDKRAPLQPPVRKALAVFSGKRNPNDNHFSRSKYPFGYTFLRHVCTFY